MRPRRTTRPTTGPERAGAADASEEEEEEPEPQGGGGGEKPGAYFLHGTYLDDLERDDDEDGDGLLETHGCLARLRVWTASLLHPRRHSARVLSWAALDEHRYNPLY